jgi:hypothetical protein
MASDNLSGATQDEVERLRAEWNAKDKDMPFEQRYCLAEIPNQPDDYDGPQRYCQKMHTMEIGSSYRCKFHGGAGSLNVENLEDPAAAPMKHGMHAARDNLVNDFDEKDRALYDWIIESYSEAYNLNPKDDPSNAYDLHRLAAEIVRAERGRGYVIQEGEVAEDEVVSDEGLVVDQDGEVVTEKSEHYLHGMLYQQDSKITKLEKELGVTRKERQKQQSQDNAVDAIKQFSELGKTFIDRENEDFDPDDAPWTEDDDNAPD